MSTETVRKMLTAAVAGFTTVPVVWENHPPPGGKAAWGRFCLIFGTAQPGTLGVNKFSRVPGVVHLQLFLPENSGTTLVTTAADALAALLNDGHLRSGDVIIRLSHVSIQGYGIDRAGGWHQKNLACTFQADCYPAGSFPP